jgi:DNA topoisomerase-1
MNDLYLNKVITYPRTDSDIYKPSFNHSKLIQQYSAHSKYGTYASKLTKNKQFNPTRGKKDAGDHPPITPLESLELNSSKLKNSLQRKVYDLLSRHYLALFGDKAVESKVYLRLSIKNEIFNSSLVSLVSKGFLEIAPFLKRKYSPLIKIQGNSLPIKAIHLNQKETNPPSHYTDTSLLKLMEKNNLGTKSTRPVIIQTLQDRGVIEGSKRHYEITPLGTFLIENLIEIWLPFLKPKFTQMIESLLNDIKNGKKSKESVIKAMRTVFLKLFDKFLANKTKITSKMKKLDKKQFTNTKSNNKRITSASCPFCKQGNMKLITPKNKRRFLVCTNENCSKKYLSVPKRGRIYILKNGFCSKCGFNIFKIYIRKGNKSYPYYICPYCWNQGLEENISGKGFCSNCSEYEIKNNKCIKK